MSPVYSQRLQLTKFTPQLNSQGLQGLQDLAYNLAPIAKSADPGGAPATTDRRDRGGAASLASRVPTPPALGGTWG